MSTRNARRASLEKAGSVILAALFVAFVVLPVAYACERDRQALDRQINAIRVAR